MTLDGIINQTNFEAENGSLINRTISGLIDGIHYWNITCEDNASNINTSLTRNFTVDTPPSIVLGNPVNDSWSSTGNITFFYTPYDAVGIANCSLIIDGITNVTNNTIYNNSINNFTVYNLEGGTHTWAVNCTDPSGNAGTSSLKVFNVDKTKPSITLNFPGPGSIVNTSTINFNFTVIDDLSDQLQCNITIDNIVNNTSPITADNNAPKNYPISGIGDGLHYWNITCWDNANNTNISLTRNFTIISPPSINLLEPVQNYWDNVGNISFVYYVSDNTGLSNCSLIINNEFNQTNQTRIINNENNTINLTNMPEGTYNWSINCSDTNGNIGNSSLWVFYVDKTKPTIDLSAPPNESTIEVSSLDFNFTVEDNMAVNLTCNLTIDGNVDDLNSNIVVANGLLKTHTIYDIEDGDHNWSVTCWDNASNINTSANWTFTSLVPPIITLNSPADGIWNSTNNITFYYNVSDASGVESCSLFIDGKLNMTNESAIVNNAENNFTVYYIPSGMHNWSINCTDLTSIEGNSSTRTFYLDTTKPSITLNFPGPGSIVNTSTINFNFTVIDDLSDQLQCNITIDNIVNNTSPIIVDNNTPEIHIISGMRDGLHYWNVTCWDNANNTNISLTRNFTIQAAPSVSLVSPINGHWNNTGDTNFIYYVTDNNGIANCSLIINNEFNQTNQTRITNNDNNTISLNNMPEGTYNWSVNCTDLDGNTANSLERILYIDTTQPSITINSPNEGNISETSFVEFNFTVEDNMASTLLCDLTINGSINNTSPIVVQNNIPKTYNVSGFTDGLFYWNITCEDNASNINTSLTRNFTIAESPTILLGNPENNTWLNNNTVSFFFTPSDNSGQIENCTLILDNQVNQSNLTILAGQENNITIYDLADGKYSWTINCSDPSGNSNENKSQKLLYVDTTGPAMTLHFPDGILPLNYDDVTFNWTAVDNIATNMTCNITLDGIINVSNIPIINDSIANVTIINLTLGSHEWNVTCWDTLNNTNTSETITFNINSPDLTLNASEIMFNNTNPEEGHNITINATIYNIGGIAATNFVVRFFDGQISDGTQIGDNITIPFLENAKNITVNVTWIATLGLHNISVVVDAFDNVTELNESNNIASNNITISSWHTVYGRTSGSLSIQSLTNFTVFSWFVSNESSGNVFAVDYDSSISWDNLTAIGVDINGGLQMDDYDEIDNVLGVENYTDSVNRTFTQGGLPRNKSSFVVFSKTITNVSIVNSTNTSNFITGLLWDSSDSGNEFDTTQDLIIITKINSNKQGAYGIYDFEMRVPSQLKKYITDDQSSVALYVELK